MTFKTLLASISLGFLTAAVAIANDGSYQVKSPDGHLCASVVVGTSISYTVATDTQQLIAPSEISMKLSDGIVFGQNDKVRKVVRKTVDETLPAVMYKKAEVRDNYNEMTLVFKEFSLIFRAYDEGVAYRFKSNLKGDFNVVSEQAEFAFDKDWNGFIPYIHRDDLKLDEQFYQSFESQYTINPISQWNKEKMAFAPIAVAADNGVKVLITEADLLNYPGMYFYNEGSTPKLTARFAGYPKEIKQGGHNMLQGEVQSRENFIAKASGQTAFPWRIIMVTEQDADLAVNDMVWKLATPQDASVDYSWVRPGKVAWDWWNDWNIYDVDFRAGINNDTYKYYIDFAASHGLQYVILDEGWAVNLKADLLQVIPEIDLPMLSQYAQERGIGLILWAGYYAFDRDMEKVCEHYSKMGIKGFKIDFMDRDDQLMVDFHRRAAETAAKYQLMVDFHGTYKPTGLSRTYPNVVNYEGVYGLEQLKWGKADQVTYDVTLPYIRMAAGPMDYTQGAMRNATKDNYRPVNSEGMSQGTRCHQLAEYVVFDSPLNMLCDSPSNYMREPLCTKYISECPCIWDESRAVNGEMGKYITLARRSGDVWYVGSLTGWDERDLVLDLSFLGEGDWTMEIFKDGINADRAARDFKHEVLAVPSDRQIEIHMAPGGGWTARISR